MLLSIRPLEAIYYCINHSLQVFSPKIPYYFISGPEHCRSFHLRALKFVLWNEQKAVFPHYSFSFTKLKISFQLAT